MKLVQKILSHGLLITFIVATFFIYMKRMELFPQWFAKPAPATEEQARVKTESPATVAIEVSRPDADVSPQQPEQVKPDAAVSGPDAVVSQPGAVVSEPDAAAMEQDAAVSDPVGEMPDAAPGDDKVQASAAAVQTIGEQQRPASNDSAPVFRPLTETEPVVVPESTSINGAGLQEADVVSAPQEEVGATSKQVVEEQGTAAGQGTEAASDFQGRLELARAYFWQQDIRASLQAYQSLAESYPERAEVWGELGNLYFNIRRASEAMDSYAHAVELLTEQGDAERARALLDVMYRLDARRASQFEMRLRQTGG